MRKLALIATLLLVLVLSGCAGLTIYKDRSPSTGTMTINTIPSGLDITIERAGSIVAEGTSPLVFDKAEVNKNYVITATNADGKSVTETRSITKTGGSVTVTLNLNEE
ncbi:hypothetical protein J4409_03060 [Candidatus Woesearchaeota archaeon]|nr:hypothetical protein [Candidatus Woesearchaeota archaeon]